MDQNMFSNQNLNFFLTKFQYYCYYYVVILRKKFELSIEDSSIFHLSLGNGL
jgi:hypothetical protein